MRILFSSQQVKNKKRTSPTRYLIGIGAALGLVALSVIHLSQSNTQPTLMQTPTQNAENNSTRLTAEDRLEIIELTARHDQAIDTWNPTAYAETFAEDAVLVNPRGTFQGRAVIREALEAYEAYAKGNRHHSLSHVITANADGTVTMRSNFLTIKAANSTSEDIPYVLSHSILTDRLQKVDGTWKFIRREQTNISTHSQPW